jgi:hypothetical protein
MPSVGQEYDVIAAMVVRVKETQQRQRARGQEGERAMKVVTS